MELDPDRHRLSEAEHERIFQARIVPAVFTGLTPAVKPVAVMLGGQPGAGKSPLVDQAVQELALRGGAALVVGDDLRGFHPRYRALLAEDDKTAAFYTDRDAGRWVEKALAHGRALKVHLVIEGTMRSPDTVEGTMHLLRDACYTVDARVLAVHERWSWQGVLQRYEAQKADRGTARMTAPHSHQAAYEGSPLSVDRIESQNLADRISVMRRGGAVLYANQLVDGQWKHAVGGHAALEAERSRAMTLDEHRAYVAGYERLAEQVVQPDRRAERQEIEAIQCLRDEARRQRDAHALRSLPRSSALKLSPVLASAYEFLDAVAAETARRGASRADAEAGMELAKSEVARRIAAGEFRLVYPDRDLTREPSSTRNSGPATGLDR